MQKKKFNLSEKEKYKAIERLIKNGSRHSEWAEAGLLHAIEKIINDEADDSSDSLKKLMKEANEN